MLGVPASILLGNAGRRPPAAFPRQRGDGRVDRDLPGGIFENFRADDTANGPGQPCSQPSHFGAGVLPFTGRRGGIVALSAVVCFSRTNREWRRFSTISITVSISSVVGRCARWAEALPASNATSRYAVLLLLSNRARISWTFWPEEYMIRSWPT